MNEYAKMGYHSPALFEAVADAAIPIFDTFNPQEELTNILNEYAMIRIWQSPALFEAVADALMHILDTFNT